MWSVGKFEKAPNGVSEEFPMCYRRYVWGGIALGFDYGVFVKPEGGEGKNTCEDYQGTASDWKISNTLQGITMYKKRVYVGGQWVNDVCMTNDYQWQGKGS